MNKNSMRVVKKLKEKGLIVTIDEHADMLNIQKDQKNARIMMTDSLKEILAKIGWMLK
ncbi:hypothetical protein ACFL2R_00255 [Patescibacteria group bacterium]